MTKPSPLVSTGSASMIDFHCPGNLVTCALNSPTDTCVPFTRASAPRRVVMQKKRTTSRIMLARATGEGRGAGGAVSRVGVGVCGCTIARRRARSAAPDLSVVVLVHDLVNRVSLHDDERRQALGTRRQ